MAKNPSYTPEFRRKPVDVIHHTDQGSQYASIASTKRCESAGVRPSMGAVGDCYDNAMCESFYATLECALLVTNRFRDHREAELAIFGFIENWYNPRRRHTALGNLSPMEFERRRLRPHDVQSKTLHGSEQASVDELPEEEVDSAAEVFDAYRRGDRALIQLLTAPVVLAEPAERGRAPSPATGVTFR